MCEVRISEVLILVSRERSGVERGLKSQLWDSSLRVRSAKRRVHGSLIGKSGLLVVIPAAVVLEDREGGGGKVAAKRQFLSGVF